MRSSLQGQGCLLVGRIAAVIRSLSLRTGTSQCVFWRKGFLRRLSFHAGVGCRFVVLFVVRVDGGCVDGVVCAARILEY